MSKRINHTISILVLLAFLISGVTIGAHDMMRDFSAHAPHHAQLVHAEVHGDTHRHGLPDPVCKQHCLGMPTPDRAVTLGHHTAPRPATPLESQAQVAGLRIALPDPPPKPLV